MKNARFLRGLVRSVTLTVAGLGILGVASLADAQTTLKVLSERFPALEYYVKAMGQAPGVKVEGTLLPSNKLREISILNLSTGSSAYDILWGNDLDIQALASKGWLEPLDPYLAKYNAQYHLDDFPASVLKPFTYEGKVYALPFGTNVMFLFYRKDLLEAKGIKPPQTFDEYLQAAKALTTKDMFGTTMCLKRVSSTLNDFQWYLNGHGGHWFDAKWKPAFNSPEGVQAVEALKEMMKYAPPGVHAYGNDECTVALTQGVVAMGLQWQSRAAAMDNPKTSKVVGKIEWASPPSRGKGVPAGQRLAIDAYVISKFSKADKDLVFRTLAYASRRESMRGAAKLALPTRAPLLKDPELVKQYRDWPAALAALQVAQPLPPLPEFLELGEGITTKIQQALAGQLTPKQALDQAAKDAEDLLRSRGYYK
ncbi:MAG: sugar ABC transporter substrate-binding protein [candidate division NC10 bacterium]|nr:sugar ABC transporter substrate-binding protein [candidate division NC10 bacterium]